MACVYLIINLNSFAVKQMASPFLKYYDFDPKLLLPSGINSFEAANEIRDYYFHKRESSAEKYIKVNILKNKYIIIIFLFCFAVCERCLF